MTTIQELIDYTRSLSNMEQNEFVTDPQVITMLNFNLAELDDIMVAAYDDYKIKTYLSTLTNPNYIIPMPPDFLKARAIDYSPSLPPNSNGWYTINSYQLPERNRFNNSITNIISPWGKVTLAAREMGNSIYIAPSDEAGGCYQIWYTPKYEWLPNADSKLPPYMDTQGWVKYAVMATCGDILDKMNLDSSAFVAKKAEQKDRVLSASKNRNSSGPKRMANVRFMGGTDYGTGFGNGFGGW